MKRYIIIEISHDIFGDLTESIGAIGSLYGLFMALNVFPALADGGLLSAGRLSSVLFPAFIWLATAVPPGQRPVWIATFAALQAFGAALFYTWRPLF